MSYASLAECVNDLERNGQLKRIDRLLDPELQIPWIQRRAFQKGAPALLFTQPKGCRFPLLANLFGTRERVNFIFRSSLGRVKAIFEARADFQSLLKKPGRLLGLAPVAWHMRPKKVKTAPVLDRQCRKSDLPRLVSWPGDGGAFITLPLVYSEDPLKTGAANLGMYRIQLDGNDYAENEAGLHYQLKRGIGIHHAHGLQIGATLPVNIHIGGPPALTLAAVMPMPEGMSELVFAGLLGGRRVRVAQGTLLPILADADFVLQTQAGNAIKPEGPFGDHLGYYSLRHDFPVLTINSIHHRQDAIWPFTTVGRPPQEDTVFGDFIHEFTAPLVGQVFAGLKEIHAVDAAGVHPLLLALGEERYTAYEAVRKPRELLTLAMHLLGSTQTALAKYLLIASSEDAPGLTCRDVAAFLQHLLERTDFQRDLIFISQSNTDTLDYSGYRLHEGSRLIWAAAGSKRRTLTCDLANLPHLPPGFGDPRIVLPGILALRGPAHELEPDEQDAKIATELCSCLANWAQREEMPLVVLVDDPDFCSQSLANFLWLTFTRSDPARDIYGVRQQVRLKRWSCEAPLIIDARLKSFQAQPLQEDPGVTAAMEALATHGGPLENLV